MRKRTRRKEKRANTGWGGGLHAGKPLASREQGAVDELREILKRGANDIWHLGLTGAQVDQFVRYAELLIEWNATRMNLTRLVSPRDIAVKHFLDSLALLTVLPMPQDLRVLDVGTGAGLPGLALKIARPDLRVTLLDSTAKKLGFCRAVADDLGLEGVETVHARAEDAAKLPARKGQFDLVIARAVAPLATLLPWLVPFAVPSGRIAALKGASVAEEMAALPAPRRLGLLPIQDPIAVTLPEADEETVRQIVLCDVFER